MRRSNLNDSRMSFYGVGIAAAIAAGATFLFDPRSGTRRRALLRDQLNHMGHRSSAFVGKVGRDARQRTRGLYERSAARLHRDKADDQIIEARVRAALGRLTSHPGAIDVACSDHVIRLRGDVLIDDLDAIIRGVSHVRGVHHVVDEMRAHANATHISALQGGNARHPSPRFEFGQINWSPAPRAVAGTAGLALLAASMGRSTPARYGLAITGAALLVRSICNAPLPHLIGLRTDASDSVRVQKSIQVAASAAEAYESWRNLERLPRFMSHVREVRKIDDTRYHWFVDGPAGRTIEWQSEITADIPGELIAWRTVAGSSVQCSGIVRFEPVAGGTRVHVRMSYCPPGNALGHTVAKLFGRDPKHQMDEDMLRFKNFIEASLRSQDGAAATASRGESSASATA